MTQTSRNELKVVDFHFQDVAESTWCLEIGGMPINCRNLGTFKNFDSVKKGGGFSGTLVIEMASAEKSAQSQFELNLLKENDYQDKVRIVGRFLGPSEYDDEMFDIESIIPIVLDVEFGELKVQKGDMIAIEGLLAFDVD